MYTLIYLIYRGFPGGSEGGESACNEGDPGSIPGSKIPWRRKWQPTPVFLPRESRGQRTWWVTVHGIAKSQIRLSNSHFTFYIVTHVFIYSFILKFQACTK